MVATGLTQTRHRWHPTLSAGAVIGLTAFGVGLALVNPGLAGSTRPHPTLPGSLGDAAGILQNNARVLAAPFLFVVLDFPQSSLGRRAGDLIVAALTAASTIPVGIELGRWQGRLLPYLPQLPLEWAALAVAVHVWIRGRRGCGPTHRLMALAGLTLALLIAAASLETWATPHRAPQAPTALSKVAENA
jgi:hypothetical protein